MNNTPSTGESRKETLGIQPLHLWARHAISYTWRESFAANFHLDTRREGLQDEEKENEHALTT